MGCGEWPRRTGSWPVLQKGGWNVGKVRFAAGHAGFADSKSGRARSCSWVCDSAAASAGFAQCSPGSTGLALSGAAPAREPKAACRRLERNRYRPRSQVLSPHSKGPQSARNRSCWLAAIDRSRRADSENVRRRRRMNWLNRLLGRAKVEDQLEKELRFHLEQHTADLMEGGVDVNEARRRARIALGGPEQ